MRKRLTSEEKKQHVLKQTLTSQQINRLESYPNARRVNLEELEQLRLASAKKDSLTIH